MLGKLLKYEFKATGRTFIPLYIAIILVALINGLVFNGKGQITSVQGIGFLVLGVLFVALGVLTIVVTLHRFSRNLLGDEGYLMFTLPVTPKVLIISKVVVSTVWFILSGITSMVSFMLLGLTAGIKAGGIKGVDFSTIWDGLLAIFRHKDFGKGLLYLIGIVGLLLLAYIIFTLTVYLSLAIGQLPVFNKFKKLAPFISFFVINFIVNIIAAETIEFVGKSIEHIMFRGYVTTIICTLILFFSASYILEKKLNIE